MDTPVAARPRATDEAGDSQEDRGGLLAFVKDTESEAVLREGLTDAGCTRLDIRHGGIRVAVGVLRNSPTPRVLIVDVDNEGDPVRALQAVADVAEPSVAVLVIGDSAEVDFYRELIRGLGVAEYLPKPLNRERVAQLFGPIVRGQAYSVVTTTGGRSVAVTGASGGVGATTLAVNLAWHLAARHRRHTCLLDADMYFGTAALMLDVGVGDGLLSLLQAPDRIDTVVLERATEMVHEDAVEGRLRLLAGEVLLDSTVDYVPGAAAALLEVMRDRFNVVVADTPFTGRPFARDVMISVSQRLLVLEPALGSVRGTLRMLEMAPGPNQVRAPILVLNRLGRAGGLSQADVEQTLGRAVDVTIPELPGKVAEAANLGRPLVESSQPLRNAMEQLSQQLSIPRLVRAGSPQRGGTRRGERRLTFGRLLRRK